MPGSCDTIVQAYARDPDEMLPIFEDGKGISAGQRNFAIDEDILNLPSPTHPEGTNAITGAAGAYGERRPQAIGIAEGVQRATDGDVSSRFVRGPIVMEMGSDLSGEKDRTARNR